jgi:hypothetical protein
MAHIGLPFGGGNPPGFDPQESKWQAKGLAQGLYLCDGNSGIIWDIGSIQMYHQCRYIVLHNESNRTSNNYSSP